MIYKFIFSISGDLLLPENIIDKIEGNFIVDNYFKANDKNDYKKEDEYGYGGISFWHPQKFALPNRIVDYEIQFVDFIEKNHQLFIDNGADEFQIFIEIYFDGGQCNFEVFDKELLKKLSRFGVSLPISVYLLAEKEIQDWEREIEIDWQS